MTLDGAGDPRLFFLLVRSHTRDESFRRCASSRLCPRYGHARARGNAPRRERPRRKCTCSWLRADLKQARPSPKSSREVLRRLPTTAMPSIASAASRTTSPDRLSDSLKCRGCSATCIGSRKAIERKLDINDAGRAGVAGIVLRLDASSVLRHRDASRPARLRSRLQRIDSAIANSAPQQAARLIELVPAVSISRP